MSMDPTEGTVSDPRRRFRPARFAAPLAGLALLTVGLVLILQPLQRESFGWFAYAPLSQRTFTPQAMTIMDAGKWAALALIGLGVATFAFWFGYRAGQRSGRKDAGRPLTR